MKAKVIILTDILITTETTKCYTLKFECYSQSVSYDDFLNLLLLYICAVASLPHS